MASRNTTIDDKPLVKQWLWPLRLGFWTLVVTAGLWIFTIAASTWWAEREAPGDALTYQRESLARDLESLAQLEPQFFVPSELARWIGDTLHGTMLNGFMKIARAFMNPPTAKSRSHFAADSAVNKSADPGGDYVKQATHEAGADWNNIVIGTYVFAARTAWFAACLPAIALALAVGLVDGLVARAKRKAEAGYESAGLYHRAKLGLSFCVITGFLISLALKDLPAPWQLAIPIALSSGFLLRLQAAFYKKYL